MSNLMLDPGWYADPYGGPIERYHNGGQWTERVRMPGSREEMVEPTARPRSGLVRNLGVIIAALLTLAIEVLSTYWTLYVGVVGLIPLVGWAIAIVVVAPYVSYTRWFAIAPLVPLFGVVLAPLAAAVVARRLLLLPYCDWPLTPEVAHQWEQVRNPADPGTPLYMRKGAKS